MAPTTTTPQIPGSKHKFNIEESKPVFSNEYGNIRQCTTSEIPILKNLSMQRIDLNPSALLEPNWFVNCNVLGYCLTGTVLVSVLDTGSQMASITVHPGQMFHIPIGALYHIENTSSSSPTTVLLCARHESPHQFHLSSAAATFTDAVMANTYDAPTSTFTRMRQLATTTASTTNARTIVSRSGSCDIPSTAHWPSPSRFSVEAMQAPTSAPGVGSAKKARSQYWKALTNMAMYSLRIEDAGMREPHWHPDTVEVGFIHEGVGRMSIMDPDGSVDTFLLVPGEVYFIPANYPHQIEVVGPKDESIHFLIFFDQPMPKDVGFRQIGIVFSRKVIAAAFGVDEGTLPDMPWDEEDPLLVGKRNEKDPVRARL